MPTITMRQIKQNPHAVVEQILAANQRFRITSHGHDTGVVIQPATLATGPQRFVPGTDLQSIGTENPLTPAEVQAWLDDIYSGFDDDVIDPWERQ